MIYAEWTLYGEFENGIFSTWDEYHAATFNPDIEIKAVRVIRIRTAPPPCGAFP